MKLCNTKKRYRMKKNILFADVCIVGKQNIDNVKISIPYLWIVQHHLKSIGQNLAFLLVVHLVIPSPNKKLWFVIQCPAAITKYVR